jgi:transposase
MNTDARPPSAENDLKQLSPDELIARILELQSHNQQLAQRIEQLEELFRLAQLKRFAPSSEKLKDRVFDEAEQIAATEGVQHAHQAD